MNASASVVAASSTPSSHRDESTVERSKVAKRSRLNGLDAGQIPSRIQLEIAALDQANQEFNDCLREFQYLKALQTDEQRLALFYVRCRQTWTFIKSNLCFFSASKHTVTNIPSFKISDEQIWRNPFTKVEGVIRTLLTIRKCYPNEKALVICTVSVFDDQSLFCSDGRCVQCFLLLFCCSAK